MKNFEISMYTKCLIAVIILVIIFALLKIPFSIGEACSYLCLYVVCKIYDRK